MLNIFAIPAFTDNYIWTIVNGKEAIVIDPGDAKPVIDTFKEKDLTLTKILITHHHFDHCGGIEELRKRFNVKVFGPEGNHIKGITNPIRERESIDIFGESFEAISTPGHTDDQLGYYCGKHIPPILFSGDTLFAAGCGRLFEGTPLQMYDSLYLYSQLPKETLIYCGHEYTESNLNFALSVEPKNDRIKKRLEEVKELRKKNLITLPSTIDIERKTNPFMRCEEDSVCKAANTYLGKELKTPVDIFATIRNWKDNY